MKRVKIAPSLMCADIISLGPDFCRRLGKIRRIADMTAAALAQNIERMRSLIGRPATDAGSHG